MAIVGRFFDFLNPSRGRCLLSAGVRLKHKLATWCFPDSALLCRLLPARRPRAWFSFGEKCPRFVQLLGKVTDSGRFLEKLNGALRPPFGFVRSGLGRRRGRNGKAGGGSSAVVDVYEKRVEPEGPTRFASQFVGNPVARMRCRQPLQHEHAGAGGEEYGSQADGACGGGKRDGRAPYFPVALLLAARCERRGGDGKHDGGYSQR